MRIIRPFPIAQPSSNVLTIPLVGENFELTLDPRHISTVQMIQNFGYDPREWTSSSSRKMKGVAKPYTRKFTLVETRKRTTDWERIYEEIYNNPRWYIPEDQWLQSFMARYIPPDQDGRKKIGIIGCGWWHICTPYGYFSYCYGSESETWIGGFHGVVDDVFHTDEWLWLTGIKD